MGLSRFFEDIVAEMDRNDNSRLSRTEGNHSILLIAPDGGVWEARIGNTGVITTTKVQAG